jgi:drug/metabolite transporter (DMT)-like permease
VAIAGIAMLLFMMATGRAIQFRLNWKQYMVLGTLNSALPFALFSYAALTLPAGYSAILNATTPLWGALIGTVVLDERLTARKIAGLFIGVVGVAFLVRLGPAQFSPQLMIAALACVAAAMCYGAAGVYTKKAAVGITPPLMATGSQLAAALVLLPFLPLSPLRGEVTPFVAVIACALALLCSAIAYFLYFRLIADLGPTKAMTVTFLIPLFALIWGGLFLHEEVNLNTLIGCALVVLATWLVVFQGSARVARQEV